MCQLSGQGRPHSLTNYMPDTRGIGSSLRSVWHKAIYDLPIFQSSCLYSSGLRTSSKWHTANFLRSSEQNISFDRLATSRMPSKWLAILSILTTFQQLSSSYKNSVYSASLNSLEMMSCSLIPPSGMRGLGWPHIYPAPLRPAVHTQTAEIFSMIGVWRRCCLASQKIVFREKTKHFTKMIWWAQLLLMTFHVRPRSYQHGH